MWMIFHVFVIYLMFSSLSIKLFLETRKRNPTWTCFQKEELTEKMLWWGSEKEQGKNMIEIDSRNSFYLRVLGYSLSYITSVCSFISSSMKYAKPSHRLFHSCICRITLAAKKCMLFNYLSKIYKRTIN